MVQLSDAAAAPSATLRYPLLDSAHLTFATFAIFTVFAGNFWRNLIGWYGWAVIIVALLVISAVWMARTNSFRLIRRLPVALTGFAAYAVLSTLWSNWRLETLAGSALLFLTVLLALPLAIRLTWDELLVAFSRALRAIVGLSILFELWVSLVIRHPVLPVYIDWTTVDKAPLMLLWSRNLLFVDGKIQGILGNSSMLAGVALLALIAIGVQLAAGRTNKYTGSAWIVVIIGTLVLTRSATVTIAGVVVLAVLVVVLLRRRLATFRSRATFSIVIVIAAVVALIAAASSWSRILALFGKSDDLTGRVEIWNNVIGLAVQRPAFGWGWLGYWPPWVKPLNDLNIRYGVVQLHAHDAWLDLWMQVGIVGLVIFALLVLATTIRSVLAAVNPVWRGDRFEFRAVTLLPLLVMTMLLVQSITESRFLVEEGLLMLCLLAIKLKLDPFVRDEPRIVTPAR